ncbi:MAG: RtcB family protein [Candidatus Brocadiae bacterium]|nr:RtcB family protein [Candidatus Brocadiia bacterium]
MSEIEIKQIEPCLYEIPKQGGMRVPGRIYANEKVLRDLYQDESLKQVMNVAYLPGIVGYSLAMPDIHWGYGFPIGGVAAMDQEEGVVTPGGIGFDINCGVRLIKTDLFHQDIQSKLRNLVNGLFQSVPSGVGSHSRLRPGKKDFQEILEKGAKWAISQGYGSQDDLDHIEENGCIAGADSELVSPRAKERGLPEVGTLGAGNHFLEIDVITEIYDKQAAASLGLSQGQIMVQIHTGSRGLGHQVCDDYIKVMSKALNKYKIQVPDPQLCCAPLGSEEGLEYCSAMACAANFAFVNRQTIHHFTQETFLKILSITPRELNMSLIYDICHNIGKWEEHEVDGKPRKLFVHRKGATRAFGPGHKSLPEKYRKLGQPVLIPGDMGRYSFLLLGTDKAMKDTFGSACHGAGRVLSRTQALKNQKNHDIIEEIEKEGVMVAVKSKKTLAEEMPSSYKDVEDVVSIMQESGISKKVVKLKPIAVTKG